MFFNLEELNFKRQEWLSRANKEDLESLSTMIKVENEIKRKESIAKENYEKTYIETGSFETGSISYYIEGFLNDKDLKTLRNRHPGVSFEIRKNKCQFSINPEYFQK